MVDAGIIPGTDWVGSLQINSQYPVAAKIIHENASGTFARSYSGSANGSSLIYAPSAYKNAFGNNTGIVVQNLSDSQTTNVTLWYCDRTVASLSNCYSEVINTLDAERAAGINLATSTVIAPASWTGTIKAQSSNGVPLAMSVNNSNSVGSLDYNASASGGQIAYLPGARRNVTGNANDYTSYIVRNVAGTSINITALFFAASDGALTWTQSIPSLSVEQAAAYSQKDNANLPSGWQGSIVLVSTGPILAVMQENTAASFDGNNATNR